MKRSVVGLLSSLVALSVLAACGGDDDRVPEIVDGGDTDAGARDAGSADAGDAAGCADEDGDGHAAASCGGDDCNDEDATRFPGATEVCNGGVDDDCNGLADADDGVCIPCGAGYTGFDASCTNVDECATADVCGTGATACTDLPGTFVCTCGAGYAAASPTGAFCQNVNECLAATNPCGAGACTDNPGAYMCTCPFGYQLAVSPTIACVDFDECAEGTATCSQIPLAPCMNTTGSYSCTCPSGYEGTGRGAGGCADIDECARGTDDCESLASCANALGGFTCACPTGFVGTGHGVGNCRWNDPALASLTLGAGARLSPAFVPGTTMYTLTLPPSTTSATITPTVARPTGATITVGGATTASGASTTVSAAGLAPRVVSVVVTTESGATRSYTILVVRSSTYVKASNTGAGDQFGLSVSLSSDGTRLAVGAPSEASSATGIGGNEADNSAPRSGAVYVFSRVGTTWTQEAYVKASNTGAADQFGLALALSADGSRLAVSARDEGSSATGIGGNQADDSFVQSGAVYVFSRAGTTWTQEAYVKASNTNFGARFGYSVSLSSDGARLAVGSRYESSSATGVGGNQADSSTSGSGAVYVFSRVGTVWTQEAYVKASNTGAGDYFGWSVALSLDGTRLAVGAPFEASSASGIGGNQADDSALASGAVYVFSRVGTTWTQEAYIKASNTGASDQFGYSVSLSSDATRLAVGARFEASSATGIGGNQADNGSTDSGAVYVFSRVGTAWTQEAYIKASNTGAEDYFGWSVSLSSDGTRLAVGSPFEDSSATGIGGNQADNSAAEAGAVYVFSRVGTTWTQDMYVKASNTAAGDSLSRSVSLSSDGTRLAVGAFFEDSSATGVGGNEADDSVSLSGAVYAL